MIPLGVLAGSARVGAATVSDTFNRADGSIGTADSGHVWTAHAGTWDILSNKAVCSAAAADMVCTVDYAANCTIQSSMVAATSRNPGIVGRFVDVSNFYLLSVSSGNFDLYRKQGGTYTQLNLANTISTAGLPVTLVISEEAGGTRLITKLNGDTTQNVLDNTSGRPSGTRVGMRFGYGGGTPLTEASWDDFTAV